MGNTPIIKEVEDSGIGHEDAAKYAALQVWESNDTVMLMPTRGTGISIRVWRSHDRLLMPMNMKKCKFDVEGQEVGAAYEMLFDSTLNSPATRSWPWILTTEDDNLPEPEAFYKLLMAIRHCPDCKAPIGNEDHCPDGHKAYDGISALYWAKVSPSMPMAFGDPKKGKGFATQDVYQYMVKENPLDQVLEVNAIANGFSLFRRSMVERVSKPRFETANPELDEAGDRTASITQDLYFCIKAKEEVGARFAVHCGVKCGHIDTKTGKVY